MDKTPQILIVGSDPALPAEFESALSGVPNMRAVTHYAATYSEAVEIAISRHPQLVVVQMGMSNRDLVSFAHEIQASLPETVLVALYRSDHFDSQDKESGTIIELLRARVQDFLRRPVSSVELRQVFDRLFARRDAAPASFGKVVSFISNRGGVGKSTLSVNTACELALRHPGKVLLVDASLQLGLCALMLDLVPDATIVDAVRERDRLDETLLRRLAASHACGLHVLAAPPDAVAASEIDDASLARVLNLARRAFDYVVVDTFPMMDSAVMAVLDLSDASYIVTQGTAPSVVGTARLLPVLDGIGFPQERQRLVLNQNYPRFSGRLTVADIEERVSRPIDHVFPYQRRLLVAMNTGRPYILRALRFYGFGRAVVRLADEIEAYRILDSAPAGAPAAPSQEEAIVRRATA